ncbi:MAG: ribosome maturation factor RimP [Thermodesulfobacterium sp.]|uniref:Ribosome maturation factor RimP n=1 Tax=Candidatus Thermodesulfobacterium syntrophicum TaxID=3060442 RepID=A0AAE3P5D0_9BACT|nr:ribosome maturation factor RimP [Thermodesulfobacterium sp.]MDF2954308.1 Ribosome maturation factor RimP [Candidatus Thermodesulfobacterium syntrophicum]
MEEEIKEKIKEIIEIPILRKNMELVDLEWRRERHGWVLRIFIDKPGGVTVEDCAKISGIVGEILDKEDIIHHSYVLEVSSPGIERPLVKKEDYERFRGEKAKITLKTPISGRRNFTGIIIGIKNDLVQMEVEGKVWEFSLENIKKAKLQPEIGFK